MTVVKTHIDRRSFFKTTAVVGGGMLIGFNWLAACQPQEKVSGLIQMPEEWFKINAYLKIGDNGVVTILSQNPEIGQNVKTSMPMIVAEELDVDWDNVVVEQAPLDPEAFERQVAGGSQSIRQGWDGLRRAGATAKALLVAAAANRWEVDPGQCTASKGVITGPQGQTLGYGEVASEAALLEIPDEVTLKDRSEYKIIGTDRGNVDIDGIITGKPLFGLDFYREGMEYAVVLRPPAFGMALKSVDDSDARAVNGVTDVIRFGNKVAVLGRSTWAAMKGKKALIAEWMEESGLESTSDHDRILHGILEGDQLDERRKDGDLYQAFADADEVIERKYEAPFLPHNTMEPMNFFADVREDKVEMIGPIQTPKSTRKSIADLLERPEEEISMDMTRQGGGFGRRLYGDFAREAAEISQKSGKPIQVVFTREDDMTAGTYRPASKYRIQASVKNGDITGYRLVEACVNGNMYGLIPNFFPAGAISNYLVETGNYESNITTGAWRAPYTNFHAFAEQSFFDELAEKLGKDPLEMRLDLLERAKPVAENDENIQYEPARLQGVIRLAAQKGNWGNPGSGIFQGFSAYYCHNSYVAEVAEVKMVEGMPVVSRVVAAIDCGIVVNPQAAINQCQGGVIDGIGHAMYGELSFRNGRPSSSNFDSYRLIRMNETPRVEIHFVDSDIAPTGLGEPPLPPAGGAVANAIYKATGQRLYRQPFIRQLELIG